jgi:nucleotide-binding universal stress UspA family protein
MGFKEILVHLDGDKQGLARLETAIHLAGSHEARLVGLHVVQPLQLPAFIEIGMGRELLEAQRELAWEAAEQTKRLFIEQTDRAGISAEWRADEGDLLDVVGEHARYCDLAILGQRDPNNDSAPEGYPDRLILTSGRPILVIPYAGRFSDIGRRVMVAWNASALATRAVHDALPLLCGADKVIVMAINPKDGTERFGDVPGAAVCQHLAHHGVKAEAQDAYAPDVEEGEELLSLAADEGVDLLVAGAYGHTRWRDLVLGGVTRHLLDYMTMPVLMSH